MIDVDHLASDTMVNSTRIRARNICKILSLLNIVLKKTILYIIHFKIYLNFNDDQQIYFVTNKKENKSIRKPNTPGLNY